MNRRKCSTSEDHKEAEKNEQKKKQNSYMPKTKWIFPWSMRYVREAAQLQKRLNLGHMHSSSLLLFLLLLLLCCCFVSIAQQRRCFWYFTASSKCQWQATDSVNANLTTTITKLFTHTHTQTHKQEAAFGKCFVVYISQSERDASMQ